MIVVDTNVIAAFCTPSSVARVAEAIMDLDPNWHAPSLWQSEFRNTMVQLSRKGAFSSSDCPRFILKSRSVVPSQNTHIVNDTSVLDLAFRSGCTAYDCEFVALAESLDILLVTWDKQVLKSFPNRTVAPEQFVEYHRRKH